MNDRLPPLNPAPPALGTLRAIVTGSLVVSCLVGGAVIFSATRIGGRMFPDPLLGYVIAAVGVVALTFQYVIVPRLRKRPPPTVDEQTLVTHYGTEILLRVGIIESAIMVCYIFYLLSQNEVILTTGVVLVLSLLLLRPTPDTYRRWVASL